MSWSLGSLFSGFLRVVVIPNRTTQLLATELNALAFPGYYDATLGRNGPTVSTIASSAHSLLDNVANGIIQGDASIKTSVEQLKSSLETANNNGHSRVLIYYSPVPGPYSFGF